MRKFIRALAITAGAMMSLSGTAFAATSPFAGQTTNFNLVNSIGAGPLIAEFFGMLGVAVALSTVVLYVIEHFKKNGAGAFKHLIAGAIVATLCFGIFGVVALMINFGTTAGSTIGNASTSSSTSATSSSAST